MKFDRLQEIKPLNQPNHPLIICPRTVSVSYMAALNNSAEEKVHQRLGLLDEQWQEKKQSLRDSIMEKYQRAVNTNQAASLKERHLKRIRVARGLQCERVMKLKEDLEAKLDSWRKQLLEVQSTSIRKAEERFKQVLQKKKMKVAQDTFMRVSRHNLQFTKVKEELNLKEETCRLQIKDKTSRSDDLRRRREEALQRSRKLAAKGAELRQALRNQLNPESFDQRVCQVNIENRVLCKS